MEYSQILLEMLERIKELENKMKILENKIENQTDCRHEPNSELNKISAKYRNLAEYLLNSGKTRITLTYAQIENILGFRLPDTATNFKKSFWANTKTHSYASSWLSVGYKTKVDAENDTVVFIKNLV